ncbi:MAG: hypothetical protein KME45_19625 [Stenomitos rutilans HA7619-LM2]|nr:hypothetical protein [Stenomitos rutilans HA7619-LM2]
MQPLEQDLWQALKDALALPQSADLKRLCHLFDWAIAQLPESQQLDAAGKAIEQISVVYALKADCLLARWEATHEAPESSLPVLNAEALDKWLRQSMSIDLDVFVEQPVSKRSKRNHQPQATDSIAAVVEQVSLLEMLDQMAAEPDPDQMMRQLAGEEDPVKWSMAIRQWLREHAPAESVCLPDLCSGLGMPWVEVVLGLLLGEFILEQRGDFYSTGDVWITLN